MVQQVATWKWTLVVATISGASPQPDEVGEFSFASIEVFAAATAFSQRPTAELCLCRVPDCRERRVLDKTGERYAEQRRQHHDVINRRNGDGAGRRSQVVPSNTG